MNRVSTVFIVTDANKVQLEAYGADKDYDCIASCKLRVFDSGASEPSHWLAHGYCTEAELEVLDAAAALELLSVDTQPVNIVPRNHADQVLEQWGLEFIEESS